MTNMYCIWVLVSVTFDFSYTALYCKKCELAIDHRTPKNIKSSILD